MKVLWFSNTPANADGYIDLNQKGKGSWIKTLNQELQSKVELHIVFYSNTPRKQFKFENTFYYPINKYKSRIHKYLSIAINHVVDIEDEQKYLEIISSVNPDVIHIHGTENPFGCIIGKTEAPVITSLQGISTIISHKFCSGIDRKFLWKRKLQITDFKTIVLPYHNSFIKSRKRFKKMQKREAKNLKNCNYIIGRTSWDKRVSQVLAPRSHYFHNDEVLRENFYLKIWTPNNSAKIIIHTTNSNNYYKGFETICQSLTELNNLGIDCEWRVAGINSNDLIVKIVQKQLEHNFPDTNLILLGNLDDDSLIGKLLEADMYVMPSHIENSPNNLCEAMILGMPCIATFAGGTGTLLKDEYEGIIIQDGDPWSMAGAIIELHKDLNKALFYAGNARTKAMERHNKKKIVEELIGIYQEVLRKNNHLQSGNE